MHSVEIQQREDTASLATLERGASVWFPDGNLIVHAGLMVFRIYGGMLSKQSVVFEKMLGPLENATRDVFDGCPVLHIPYGSAETAHFLAAIFDAKTFDHELRRISFDAIAAVLRLSSTYKVVDLRRKALMRLSAVYPTTLDELSHVGLTPSYCRDQILHVIQLARENGVDWILPLAFYRLCLEMNCRTLILGFETISPADLGLCIEAMNVMRTAHYAEVLARYDRRLGDEGCTGGEPCRISRFREARTLLDGGPPARYYGDDMHEWHSKQQQTGWDGLPGMFGLPEWSTLNKLKNTALWEMDDEEEEEEEELTF
ncbi:hypothetical protein B0H13DRAFT_2339030 [Mycena leptocephala]|nr:hypothetical protein B0H13DRAFT_2339030 [Mycena leptocephala]